MPTSPDPSTVYNSLKLNDIPCPTSGQGIINPILQGARLVDSLVDESCIVLATVVANDLQGTTSHSYKIGNVKIDCNNHSGDLSEVVLKAPEVINVNDYLVTSSELNTALAGVQTPAITASDGITFRIGEVTLSAIDQPAGTPLNLRLPSTTYGAIDDNVISTTDYVDGVVSDAVKNSYYTNSSSFRIGKIRLDATAYSNGDVMSLLVPNLMADGDVLATSAQVESSYAASQFYTDSSAGTTSKVFKVGDITLDARDQPDGVPVQLILPYQGLPGTSPVLTTISMVEDTVYSSDHTLSSSFEINSSAPGGGVKLDASSVTDGRVTLILPYASRHNGATLVTDVDIYDIKPLKSEYVRVPSEYPTVVDALEFIKTKGVSESHIMEIRIAPDHFSAVNNQLLLQDYNLPRVSIYVDDVAPSSYPFSSLTISGSASNYTVTFNMSSAHNINIGDYVNVKDLVGANPFRCVTGVYKVTGVTGSTVSVVYKYAKAAFPSVGATTGNLVKLNPTYYPINLTINNCNFYKVSNILLSLLTMNSSSVNSMVDIYMSGSVDYSVLTNSDVMEMGMVVSNGYGVKLVSSSVRRLTGVFSSNTGYGLTVRNSNVITETNGIVAYGNSGYGLYAEDSTVKTVSDTIAVAIRDNITKDIQAMGNSYVYAKGFVTTSATVSPAINTTGNGISYIKV